MSKKCGLSISDMCMFNREWKSVQHSHTYHFMFLLNFVCFSPYNWLSNWDSLLGLFNWALVCGLEYDQKGTNKTLAPMGLDLFYQLFISPKLPLTIFNGLYKYSCTLGLIHKLYLKTLLYMQPLYKIFVVMQSHEWRLPFCRLLHLNPWVPNLIL